MLRFPRGDTRRLLLARGDRRLMLLERGVVAGAPDGASAGVRVDLGVGAFTAAVAPREPVPPDVSLP